jgi:hypothetical protein
MGVSKIQIPPRFGPWQETNMGVPYGTEYVLGFYGDAPCVKTKVVYCEQTRIGDEITDEAWFGIDNEEVDVPDCWAEIIYPEEDE